MQSRPGSTSPTCSMASPYPWRPTSPSSSAAGNSSGTLQLVLRRPLDVVDHNYIERRLRRFQLEPQLLLHCSKDRRSGIRLTVWSPREFDVVLACQAGLVDDDAIGRTR